MPNFPPRLYSVYGITVASALELPELAAGSGAPDLEVAIAREGAAPPPDAGSPSFAGTGDDVRLDYPRLAALRVRGGSSIEVVPHASADPGAVRALVLGAGLAVALHQRGVLALHASSVLAGAGVVAFLGGSGAGKSTAAAVLQRRGHDLVADDVTAVEPGVESIRVLPAFPQLKLWPEAAAAIGLDPDALPLVAAGEEKRARRVASALGDRRLVLARVYVLAEGDRLAVEALSPRDALIELVRHSFCARRLPDLGIQKHFVQCAETARRVPVRRLVRRRDLARLDAFADLVERDAAGAP